MNYIGSDRDKMSSCVSDDMSSCSGSPASYTTLESPHSSPLQQVPQITTTFSGVSNADRKLYKFEGNGGKPYLQITEQPQNHFRFRYDKEKSGSTHGCLLGKSYAEKNVKEKTYPTVQLVNFVGKAVIKCSIKYQNAKKELEKAYKILEDTYEPKTFNVPKCKSYQVGFRGIAVDTIKKSELTTLLCGKLSEQLSKRKSFDVKKLHDECNSLAKSMNLNVVRLKFTAYDVDTGKEICDPVLSDPIFNKKSASTNALKICRLSLYSGRSRGQEDIFLLVDKIDKKDIEVHFYREDKKGNRVWSARGEFIPNDVHYQCAIVCKTPAYEYPQIEEDVKVFIELVRPSDGSTSPPQPFLYKADLAYRQCKRRKMAKPCPVRVSTEKNITSLVNQPVLRAQRNITHDVTTDACMQVVQSEPPQQTYESPTGSEWDNIVTIALGTLYETADQSLHPTEAIQQQYINTQQGITESQIILEQQTPMNSQVVMEQQQPIQSYGTVESQETLKMYEAIAIQEFTVSQETMELQETMESQAKVASQQTLDIYSPMVPQEAIELEGAIELQGALELQRAMELQVAMESERAMESQKAMELEELMEQQETMESKGLAVSPMWSQPHQISFQPQASMIAPPSSAQLLPAEYNATSFEMEDDPISQNFFEEYSNLFGLPEDSGQSVARANKLSLVGDSGRVKVQVASSSTQTNDPSDTDPGATYDQIEGIVEPQGPAECFVVNWPLNRKELSEIVNKNTRRGKKESESDERSVSTSKKVTSLRIEAKEVENAEGNEITEANLSSSTELKEGESAEGSEEGKNEGASLSCKTGDYRKAREKTKEYLKLDENKDKSTVATETIIERARQEAETSKGAVFKIKSVKKNTREYEQANIKMNCEGEIVEEKENQSAEANVCKVNKEIDAVRNKSTDDDYPALFTQEDAAEVKKLVRELCEIIRDKKGSATNASALQEKLERLFHIRLSNGDTFLHMTLFKNQQSFEALVKTVHKANMSDLLNCSNNREETILHLALTYGDPNVVSLLVEKGCDPMARTIDEETCVHYAVRYGSEATLRALLDASARRGVSLELDARNAEQYTALHLCALEGNGACAALLCGRGAELCVRDGAGCTPLHLCAYDSRPHVARALITHASVADVDAKDRRGLTALQVVCLRAPPDVEMAEVLLSAGADPRAAIAASRSHPRLDHILRRLLSPHTYTQLIDEAEQLSDDTLSEDEYESADDESIDDTAESLATRLQDLEVFTDAESDSDIE